MTLLNSVLQNDTVKVLVLDNQKSVGEWIAQPTTMIAIAAVLLSLAGIITSIISLFKTIKHNKLSVEPLLLIKNRLDNNSNSIQVILKNNGIGTAKINLFEIRYKDKIFNDFQAVFKENKIDKNYDTTFSIISNCSYSIAANQVDELLKHTCKYKDELKQIVDLLYEAEIFIEYESMYGKKTPYLKNSKK